MKIKVVLLPSTEPGNGLSARVRDLMDRYFEILTFKNEAVQLTAAAHYSRAQECVSAAHRLLKHGDLLAAFTVMRSALETSYCLAAIAEDPKQAFEVMKHAYLKESTKEFRGLLGNGHETMKDGTNIQAQIDDLIERKKEFEGKGSSIFDLARIGNKADEYITYRLLSSYSHPASLISAVNHQLGPHDEGTSIRVGHKDVITSTEFVINASIGLDCLRQTAIHLDMELNDEYEELESAINVELDVIAE